MNVCGRNEKRYYETLASTNRTQIQFTLGFNTAAAPKLFNSVLEATIFI